MVKNYFCLISNASSFKKKNMCNKHFKLNIELVLQFVLFYSKASRAEPYTVWSLGYLRRRCFLFSGGKAAAHPCAVCALCRSGSSRCVSALGNHSLERSREVTLALYLTFSDAASRVPCPALEPSAPGH